MAYLVSVRSSLAIAAVALSLAAPASARMVDDWDVKAGATSCTMLSTFEDDVSIGLISAKGSGLSFMAGGDGMSALVHSGQKVSLTLTFAGNVPHSDWTDEAARVVPMENGEVVVIADWGASLSKELADTVTASKSVRVQVGSKVIGTYDLSGSPAAYRELSHCGSDLASK